MRILLIEDEPHKREELSASLLKVFGANLRLDNVESVHDAFWAVSVEDYDLVLLDMALPTFATEGAVAERGLDQALGGVEVLRALKSRSARVKIIIITQYPDVMIGGVRVKLSSAPKLLSTRYDQDVIGAVLYKYRSPLNHQRLMALLKKVL